MRVAGRSGLAQLDSLAGEVQRHIGERVKQDLTALLAPRQGLPATAFRRSPDDPGLFEEGSVAWKVHANRSGLVGGLRALLLQTMHPLAMAGVAQHSDYRQDPWGRLHRTGAFIGVTTYGSTTAAEAAIARVRKVHERVQGVAPDGRHYRANDPHLLAWVHDTEVDSFLRSYQRYGGGDLTPADQDRYVEEMAQVGQRLGVTEPPKSRTELRATLIAFRSELKATADARNAVWFMLWPPLPTYLRPAYGALSAAAIGLLPGFVRRQLLLPSAPLSDPLLVRPAVRLLLSGMGLALGNEPPSAEMARRESARAADHAGTHETGTHETGTDAPGVAVRASGATPSRARAGTAGPRSPARSPEVSAGAEGGSPRPPKRPNARPAGAAVDADGTRKPPAQPNRRGQGSR